MNLVLHFELGVDAFDFKQSHKVRGALFLIFFFAPPDAIKREKIKIEEIKNLLANPDFIPIIDNKTQNIITNPIVNTMKPKFAIDASSQS